MGNVGGWLRRLGEKIRYGLARFYAGRYGTDRLNSVILWTGVILCLASMLIPLQGLSLVANLLAYFCLGWSVFRSLSRNTYKRSLENRRFNQLLARLRDRDHRYYVCPKCRQQVRVPKGRGKIAITCPKCREKFVKKT